MIPQNNKNNNVEIIKLNSKTYKLNIDNDTINSYIDEKESVIQAIYKILNTRRYNHLIYSWDYGLEIDDLIGENMNFVISELKRRIIEALTQDDRIEKIYNFKFKKIDKESLLVNFNVDTGFGKLEIKKEIEV